MWVTSPSNFNQVVKYKGWCRYPAMQRYCNYWMAKKNPGGGVISYECTLFNEVKGSKPAKCVKKCNKKYGQTYIGLP